MERILRTIAIGAAGLFLGATTADAQTIGFKLGASLSNISIEDSSDDPDHRTGFVGGGFIRFGFGRLGIQPEILSVSKGAKVEGGSSAGDDVEIGLEYIAVPVLLHLPLIYGSSFAPYVFGGPEFAFEIGCDLEIAGTDYDCDETPIAEDAIETNSTDIGLTAGGGFAFAVGPGALMFEGRYTWGLTNINDNPGPDQSEIRNRSAYFMAGYSIPIGRRY